MKVQKVVKAIQTRNLPIEQRMKFCNEAIRLRMERGWGYKRIAKTLGVNIGVVGNWIHRGCRPDTCWKKPDLSPSTELSYALGVCYGDASVAKGGGRISLEAKDKSFVEETSRCLAKILRRETPYPIHTTNHKCYKIAPYSQNLAEFFRKPFDEHKPLIEEFPAPFTRGFFDSEGWVSESFNERGVIKNRYLGASNSNLIILRYISDLLLRHFSISSRITRVNKQGEKGTIRGKQFTRTKDCYILTISTPCEGMLKYHQKIGFTIRRKQEKLAGIVERILKQDTISIR